MIVLPGQEQEITPKNSLHANLLFRDRFIIVEIMKASILIFLSFLTLLLPGCTQIEINESDIFDIKRSISPDYFSSAPYDLEEVTFQTVDGLAIEGWYIRQPDADGTILYCGGNGFVISASHGIITSILEQGVDLLVFNYRGYGTNSGSPSVDGVMADGSAAYDFLIQERGVDPAKLIIHGHSLGSVLASSLVNRTLPYVSGSVTAAGVVLESPLTDAKDLTGQLLPWFLKPFVKLEIDSALLEYSNLEEVKQYDLPLLIITGSEDIVTPQGMAEKLYEHARSTRKSLEIISGGGHNDLPQRQEYRNALSEFYQCVF